MIVGRNISGPRYKLCRCNAGQSRRHSSLPLPSPRQAGNPQGDRGVVGLPMLGEGVYAGTLCTFWVASRKPRLRRPSFVLYSILGLPVLLVLAIRHIPTRRAPRSAAHFGVGFLDGALHWASFFCWLFISSPLIAFSGSFLLLTIWHHSCIFAICRGPNPVGLPGLLFGHVRKSQIKSIPATCCFCP